jgi:hypothetical protein
MIVSKPLETHNTPSERIKESKNPRMKAMNIMS